jgi:hypothetical protein
MMANTAEPCVWLALLIGGAPAATGLNVSFSGGLKKSGIPALDRIEPSLTAVGRRVSTGTMITRVQQDLTKPSCVTNAILLTRP